MRWSGMDDFLAGLEQMPVNLDKYATALAFSTARNMREYGLENMSSHRIGLVTGRSRALYGAALRGSTAIAGYLSWPDEVVFYPQFLNDGTSRTRARPYHDEAFDRAARDFANGMPGVIRRVMEQ